VLAHHGDQGPDQRLQAGAEFPRRQYAGLGATGSRLALC
jgi:hypothetical protein